MSVGNGFWSSITITVSDTSTVHNIPIPFGNYIFQIIVKQGATELGDDATMSFKLPGKYDKEFLALGTGDAKNNKIYPVQLPCHNRSGGTLGRSPLPFFVTSGGINVQGGGTIADGGTATVTVITNSNPIAFHSIGR